MECSPLGEYLGTIAKLGPLASSESCAFMSGLEKKIVTHVAVSLSRAYVPTLEDIVAVSVVAVELYEPESVMEVLGLSSHCNFDTFIC